MAPPTRTPSKDVLRRWRDAGYTQAEMVELTEKEFGQRVTRSAIANAMVRYGLAEDAPRYQDEMPWRINPMHVTAQPVRMLRLLGKRNQGRDLTARETEELTSWLRQLDEKKLILGYDYDDNRGFHYISKRYKDHRGKIPIRKKSLRMAAGKARGNRQS